MEFNDVIRAAHNWWNIYLHRIFKAQREGKLTSTKKGKFKAMYPNILLATQVDRFFIIELVGAVEYFQGLTIKEHREKSIYRYFSQFHDAEHNPVINWNGEYTGIVNLCFGREVDIDLIDKRFPQLNLYKERARLVASDGTGSMLEFGPDFVSGFIDNSLIINKYDNIYKCKSILSAYVFSNDVKRNNVFELFYFSTGVAHPMYDNMDGKELKAIHVVEDNDENLVIAGQLQSMYLFPGLRETTIGEFINRHPRILERALQTDHYVYEPYLKWIEGGNSEEKAINPDLIVRRKDGYYDIYDLKTALLAKKSLAKGPKKRRRFIDQVQEGAAQLAHYMEYFNYEKNAEYAESRYGIRINNTKCVLIIGNYENSTVEEIREASRMYGGIEIIDYDMFCQMFFRA